MTSRRGWWLLGAVLLLALVLRIWGLRHGLPLPHSSDESDHFVQKALDFFSGDYDPHYFH